MINTKLTDGTIPNLTSPASTDLLYVVDVSDSTDDPAGTSKAITYANLLKATTDRLDAEHNSDGTHSDITATSVTATTGTYTDIVTGSMDASGAVSGNTITADNSVITDTISEKTASTGVTIDGTLIKDNTITATGAATNIPIIITPKGSGTIQTPAGAMTYEFLRGMDSPSNTTFDTSPDVIATKDITLNKTSMVFIALTGQTRNASAQLAYFIPAIGSDTGPSFQQYADTNNQLISLLYASLQNAGTITIKVSAVSTSGTSSIDNIRLLWWTIPT